MPMYQALLLINTYHFHRFITWFSSK